MEREGFEPSCFARDASPFLGRSRRVVRDASLTGATPAPLTTFSAKPLHENQLGALLNTKHWFKGCPVTWVTPSLPTNLVARFNPHSSRSSKTACPGARVGYWGRLRRALRSFFGFSVFIFVVHFATHCAGVEPWFLVCGARIHDPVARAVALILVLMRACAWFDHKIRKGVRALGPPSQCPLLSPVIILMTRKKGGDPTAHGVNLLYVL